MILAVLLVEENKISTDQHLRKWTIGPSRPQRLKVRASWQNLKYYSTCKLGKVTRKEIVWNVNVEYLIASQPQRQKDTESTDCLSGVVQTSVGDKDVNECLWCCMSE